MAVATKQHLVDNWNATVASPRTLGGSSVVMSSGAGARLGALASNRVYRLTVLSNWRTTNEQVVTVIEATGLSGDTLQGVTAAAGYADQALSVGMTLELRATSTTLAETRSVVEALEAGVPLPLAGPGFLDIRQYGAVPNDNTKASLNRVAWQAAHDAAAAMVPPGVVYIPTGKWYYDRPGMHDGPGVTVVSAAGSLATQWVAAPFIGHPAFIMGVARKPFGVALTSDHLPAMASPPIDFPSTASGRYGIRFKADVHMASQGTVLDMGPLGTFWSLQQFTVEWLTDTTLSPGTGSYPNTSCLFGLSGKHGATPWKAVHSSGQINVEFQFTDGTSASGSFANPPDGVHRVAFMFDGIGGAFYALVDGQFVATSGVIPPGKTLRANQNVPFTFNVCAESVCAAISDPFGDRGHDWTLLGWHASKGLVYTPGSTGSTAVRADAASIDDNRRFFLPTSNTIAYFPMTDDPTQVVKDRVVTVVGGNFQQTAILYDTVNHGNLGGLATLTLRGLTITNQSGWGGDCITVGRATDLRISDVSLSAGGRGIGQIMSGLNSFPYTFRDIQGHGAESLVCVGYCSMVYMQNLNLDKVGRTGVRVYQGEATVEGMFATGFSITSVQVEHLVRGDEAQMALRRLESDFEGGQAISDSAIYCSPLSVQSFSFLTIDQALFGSIGDGAVLVKLDDAVAQQGVEDDGNQTAARFSMTNWGLRVQPSGAALAAVVQQTATAKGRWVGSMDATTTNLDNAPMVQDLGTGNRIRARWTTHVGPPREGTFTAGCDRAEQSNPPVGSPAEYRCVATGACGTATPPRWLGLAPIDADAALAATILDHRYWAGGGVRGFFSDYYHAVTLNRLFLGTALPASTPYAALCASPAIRDRNALDELAGGGVARVLLGGSVWSASSAGIASNAQAITFATLTGIPAGLTTLRSIGFFDAATVGNLLLSVEVPAITNLGVGSAISCGIGTLAYAPAQAGMGGLADATADAMANWFLRGTSFSAPTIYIALSTGLANPAVAPTEPSGNGYARVATAGGQWAACGAFQAVNGLAVVPRGQRGQVANNAALSFPAPTGAWPVCRSVYLMDAATSGNVIACGNLAVPKGRASGDAALSFAAGALWVGRS